MATQTFSASGRTWSAHTCPARAWTAWLGLGALLAAVLPPSLATAQIAFVSPRAALEQGIAAYQARNYGIAIPALHFAKKHRVFSSRYYLARIYADNNSSRTDHGKAYSLLLEMVNEYWDTDPLDYRRAPTMANAITRLARYVRGGIPEIGLVVDLKRAVEYFDHSASTFNDENAQFELAKMQLAGEGIRRAVPRAMHWLSVLSRNGHSGAQAFLADLYWRGKFTERNPVRALALISVALENAPSEDRVWIEDIHQNIFCGATRGTRRAATGLVADWNKKFGRPPDAAEQDGLGGLGAGPDRSCANGERVRPIEPSGVKFNYSGNR